MVVWQIGARAVPGGARHAGSLRFAEPEPSCHVYCRWARERYQAARDTLVACLSLTLNVGRWARERYQAARGTVVACLERLRPASGPPHVLRSALREEARRTIGARHAHGCLHCQPPLLPPDIDFCFWRTLFACCHASGVWCSAASSQRGVLQVKVPLLNAVFPAISAARGGAPVICL